MVSAPFIMSFIQPVPLASLPASEICSLMLAEGTSRSAVVTS